MEMTGASDTHISWFGGSRNLSTLFGVVYMKGD